MTTRRILALTSTRADFGLLSKTLRAIDTSNKLELKLCVTGTHLSKKHGETLKFIEEDGFNIAHRIPIIEDNCEEESVSASMATLLFELIFKLIKILKKIRRPCSRLSFLINFLINSYQNKI